jgi:hypothetical protein
MPLPAPRIWSDDAGAAMAADLNLDWRDSFDFLLGYSRPIGFFKGVAATAISSTAANIPIASEILKRGGLVHSTSTNPHLVTVPYTGQYAGFASVAFTSISALTLRLTIRLMQNGTTELMRVNSANGAQVGTWTVNGSFSINLAANDTVSIQALMPSGTATSGAVNNDAARLGIWYEGDAS